MTVLAENVNKLIDSVNLELLERTRAEARVRAVRRVGARRCDHDRPRGADPRVQPCGGGDVRSLAVKRCSAQTWPTCSSRRRFAPGTGAGWSGTWRRRGAPIIGKRVEISALRADGSEFPVELAISRVASTARRCSPATSVTSARRKRAEDQLQRSPAIVESSRDAIVGRTLDGARDELERRRRAAVRLRRRRNHRSSGYDPRPPERRSELDTINEKLGRGETSTQFETVRVRKDGTQIEVESTISPVEGCSRAGSSAPPRSRAT